MENVINSAGILGGWWAHSEFPICVVTVTRGGVTRSEMVLLHPKLICFVLCGGCGVGFIHVCRKEFGIEVSH